MSKNAYLFTSESVSEGHPDKIADQLSDRILDNLILLDPNARAGIEALVTSNLVVLAGETSLINFREKIDLEKQSVEQTINTLSMASPFTLEEKQILLETKNLIERKNKLEEILITYTNHNFTNKTIQ